MADQVFPYHLAGFAMGAFATGYSINSLKRYLTRPVNSIEETAVDPNLLPPIQTRKRKRDPDATPLPLTKRRAPGAVNTSLSAHGSSSSEDLNAPSSVDSVKVTSNSEQDSVEITIGSISSRPAHQIQTPYVKISLRERKHHTKCGDSNSAVSCRNGNAGINSAASTIEDEANEDYHSDRTMIGNDLEHDDDGSDDSEDQNGERKKSADEEEDDLEDLRGEGLGLKIHEEEDRHLADHMEKEHAFRAHDENDEQEDGGTCGEAIEIDIYRQNKKMDFMISIPKGRSNDLEIMVQNRQPRVRVMQRRRQRELKS